MNQDQELIHRLGSIIPPLTAFDPENVDPRAIRRSRQVRRRKHASVVVVLTAALVGSVSAGLVAITAESTRSTDLVASLPPNSELLYHGMQPMACGIAPISVLTAKGNAALADTPQAAGLRNLIEHDPTKGQYSLTVSGWVALSDRDGEAVFGQRTGAAGVRAVVTLKDVGGSFVPYQEGVCAPLSYADGSKAVVLTGYASSAETLTVSYLGGENSAGLCASGRPAVQVAQRASSVDILVIMPPSDPTPAECSLVGRVQHVTVHLTSPLGGRIVADDSHGVPVKIMQRFN